MVKSEEVEWFMRYSTQNFLGTRKIVVILLLRSETPE